MFDVSSTIAQTSFAIQEMKTTNSAEVHHGDDNCRAKFRQLLSGIGLPTELLVVEDIQECGYVEKTGFVWLKLNKTKKNHYKFDNVSLCYDDVITASLERNRIKNLTGVKAKEFLVWIALSEIHVTDAAGKRNSIVGFGGRRSSSSTITFKTPVGLSKSFPLSLFVGGDEVATKSGIQLAS